jgi:hypothetical protein
VLRQKSPAKPMAKLFFGRWFLYLSPICSDVGGARWENFCRESLNVGKRKFDYGTK